MKKVFDERDQRKRGSSGRVRRVEQAESGLRVCLAALQGAVRTGSDDCAAGRYLTFDTDVALRDHFQSLVEAELDTTVARRGA